jgi:DNA-directed RNA polymerase, mitochondrial
MVLAKLLVDCIPEVAVEAGRIYGVHACDVDLLNRILREEFVRIYSEPVLKNLLDQQRQANPDLELPELPPTGNLDIRQVLESPYFFA